jgi:uncharacterized protein YukE
MKTKILSELKTKYNNLGFGDKAFDGVADYLSKTVSEEAQVETATTGVESLLKAFQGEIDRVRGEKSNLQKEYDELKRLKGGEQQPDQNPQDKDKEDVNALIKAIADIKAEIRPLKDELTAYKSEAQKSAFNSRILAKAKELQIPGWRIEEGFSIASDATDEAINAVLSTAKQNIVTQGLERSNVSGVLITNDDAMKQEAEEFAKSLPDTR